MEKQIKTKKLTKIGLLIQYLFQHAPQTEWTARDLKKNIGISTTCHYVTWNKKYGQYKILDSGTVKGHYKFNTSVQCALEYLKKDLCAIE